MKYVVFFTIHLCLYISCTKKSSTATRQGSEQLVADTYEVTVDEFRTFVENTQYVTTADSFGWSGVFNPETMEWDVVENANWEKHDGKTSASGNFPVVHISYFDACAYCKWKGGRLPTAEEWDRLAGDTVILGNVWQGLFPYVDSGADGYQIRSAPVGRYEPNSNGLYDMFGNVWEWTTSIKPGKGERIIKGGSFLCDYNVCQGYIPSRYQTTMDDSGLNHLGFRCVYDPES